jgi:phospholipid/cholesterol/gamma-HCH transport system substrate-binding protein
MKVKFNYFERVAGLFVATAILGAIIFTTVTAIKKGWFSDKIPYRTEVSSAEGLHSGTPVNISGLRAGEVTDVELLSASKIIVHFEVLDRFQTHIRSDSVVQVVRPFIIGDKALDITVGSENEEAMRPNATLASAASFDMMDLVSGRKLGPFLGSLEGLIQNLSTLGKAFADPKRTEAFIKMFDRVDPLLINLNKMAGEVTVLMRDVNEIVPEMRKFSPQLGQNLAKLVGELNILTASLTPTLKEIGPELPKASRRALEALDETVVTLKAIQRSFILSGKVKDVREEENVRKPAQEGK